MTNDDKLFARIAPLFDVGLLSESRVLVAGCGSGGSQVALQLAMAGIRKFSLFDTDILEAENVIRHACGRAFAREASATRDTAAIEASASPRKPSVAIDSRSVTAAILDVA